jgi:hypothetical protein
MVALNRRARYFNTLLYLLQLLNLVLQIFLLRRVLRVALYEPPATSNALRANSEELVLYVETTETEGSLWFPVEHAADL